MGSDMCSVGHRDHFLKRMPFCRGNEGCHRLFFVAVVNTMTKPNLSRKSLLQLNGDSPSLREAEAGAGENHREILPAGLLPLADQLPSSHSYPSV